MQTYRDQVVLITGGASGIGRSLGTRLVARGARVVLADWNEEQARAVATTLGCESLGVDVRDPEAMAAAVDFTEDTYGPVDLLISCAGVTHVGEARDFSTADWHRIVDVNLYGVIHGIQAVYGRMVQRGRGQILNIASLAGLFPSAGQTAYVASKYGVVGLSHALRAEASRHGVKVGVVCPGIIHTPMRDGLPVHHEHADAVRALLPKGMDVDACARAILRGAARNRATILVTPMAYALAALMRLAPGLAHWLNALSFRSLLRRLDATPARS